MNIFFVFAHPDRRSLNGSLLDVAVAQLEADGHEVQVSDLYAMQWKSQVDRDDFPALGDEDRLQIAYASAVGYAGGSLTADVIAEQEKLRWADAIILQFPIWWYSMPAILKGWVERVFALGFAYGVGEHNDTRWGDRYGEGVLADKRAMILTTVGGWEEHYSGRGINGPIDDVLFPINHGILFYPGAQVLPSHIVYQADRTDEARFASLADDLRARMRTLFTDAVIPYRKQNHGDYTIPAMTLRDDHHPGRTGFDVHRA